jgi:hypothetical protein
MFALAFDGNVIFHVNVPVVSASTMPLSTRLLLVVPFDVITISAIVPLATALFLSASEYAVTVKL